MTTTKIISSGAFGAESAAQDVAIKQREPDIDPQHLIEYATGGHLGVESTLLTAFEHK